MVFCYYKNIKKVLKLSENCAMVKAHEIMYMGVVG